MKRTIAALSFAALLLPSLAFAASTHHFSCSDFDAGASTHATCSSGTITINAGFANVSLDSAAYAMTSGTTYYVSFTTVKTSGTSLRGYLEDTVGGIEDNFYNSTGASATYTDVPVSATGNWTGGVAFTTLGGGFLGTISSICISDTAGACAGGGGGGGGGGTTAGAMFGVASTTAALGTAFSSAGTGALATLPPVLLGLTGLLGIGYGLMKLRGYLTGRMF